MPHLPETRSEAGRPDTADIAFAVAVMVALAVCTFFATLSANRAGLRGNGTEASAIVLGLIFWALGCVALRRRFALS
jgi:hypothetical protein